MYPVALFSVVCAGGIWAPVPFNLTSTEVAGHLNLIKPKVVFCSVNLLHSAREACEKINIPASKIYVVSGTSHDIYNAETGKSLVGTSLLPWTRITDIDTLKSTTILLHFTSGTTGLPK